MINNKKIIKIISIILLILSIIGILKTILLLLNTSTILAMGLVMGGNFFEMFSPYFSFLLFLNLIKNLLLFYASINLLKYKNKGRIILNISLILLISTEIIKTIQVSFANSSELSMNNLFLNLLTSLVIIIGFIFYMNRKKIKLILN